jgi:hypothetical protein
VTGSAQNVTINARVTDDLSGPGSFAVLFISPTGAQSHRIGLQPTAQTPLEFTYTGVIEIPQFVESGTWSAFVQLWDRTGNFVSLDSSNLAALGFPTDLEVLSIPDTTPPSIGSVTFTPPVIDVSAGDQVVTLDVQLIDAVSGVDFDGDPNFFPAFFRAPSSGQQYVATVREFSLVQGSDLDGVWRMMLTIPQNSEAGSWFFSINLRDNAGNQVFVSDAATFEVISSVEDLSPPVLTNFSFSPLVIDTSAGSANVTVSLDLTDDLTGVDFSLAGPTSGFFHGLFFRSPSNNQSRSACCSNFSLTSGTVLDGTWQADVFFPQFSEAGTWEAQLSNVTDHVRNPLHVSPDQLEAAGFSPDLVVVRPSLVGDGSVGPAGGTVVDETFPDRAEIIFPPGMVTGDTDVAIDVFPDPLAVPNPVGFQGPGTFFVNISLTPEPAGPFPPPGVTVTLALPDFINPGTAIPLYFVDPATGMLEPMGSATPGAPGGVIGIVNADGLSATFSGISHFTILVGLVPDAIPVDIDIRPNSSRNKINIGSHGKVQVAILSSETFDAVSRVDRSTLTFGRTGDEMSLQRCRHRGKDVNRDHLPDLLCFFDTSLTGLMLGDTQAFLKGKTFANENLLGGDFVTVHSGDDDDDSDSD